MESRRYADGHVGFGRVYRALSPSTERVLQRQSRTRKDVVLPPGRRQPCQSVRPRYDWMEASCRDHGTCGIELPRGRGHGLRKSGQVRHGGFGLYRRSRTVQGQGRRQRRDSLRGSAGHEHPSPRRRRVEDLASTRGSDNDSSARGNRNSEVDLQPARLVAERTTDGRLDVLVEPDEVPGVVLSA